MLESTVMVFRYITSNQMAANMGTFMNKDIPQFLKGQPFYFTRSCMNTFQNVVEQFHKDMINISAEYQCFCTKPSEQGSFFQASRNESKEQYAMIKTYKNINISVEYQCFCTKPSEQGLFF